MGVIRSLSPRLFLGVSEKRLGVSPMPPSMYEQNYTAQALMAWHSGDLRWPRVAPWPQVNISDIWMRRCHAFGTDALQKVSTSYLNSFDKMSDLIEVRHGHDLEWSSFIKSWQLLLAGNRAVTRLTVCWKMTVHSRQPHQRSNKATALKLSSPV